MSPDDLIARYFRLVPSQATALRKMGLHLIRDLLYHFPERYEQRAVSGEAARLLPGTKVSLVGVLGNLEARKLWKSKRNITEGWLKDVSGKVKVMWFNQPYMKAYIKDGAPVRVVGIVGGTANKPYIANPEVSPITAEESLRGIFAGSASETVGGIFPVYSESQGITSRWIYHAIKRVFENGVIKMLEDPISADVRDRYNLPDIASALVWIHTPEKLFHAETARKRFAFEEIFVLQTMLAIEKAKNDNETAYRIDGIESINNFIASLPYSPTGAQMKVIGEIAKDMSGEHPMARLLEGDVGSGKTIVAATACYATVKSRPSGQNFGSMQVAFMAPTEILAKQHFESIVQYFRHLPISIGLITGSGCKKFPSKISKGGTTKISRAQLLKWVASGEISMLVGTHALIQKSVQFKHLALVVVDEQHRFGTAQRRALASKGCATPHFLSMTATPIPRTLALTMYGDLELSILDELPPGRIPVTTKLLRENDRESAYAVVRQELAKGRQAYVICPRIDEPDPTKENAVMATSAKAEAARLARDIFSQYRVGLLHGAMTPTEKELEMHGFEIGKIDILVATSVVEVGVNVPNATVIIIEGAERFGLAQLHQLRGRVLRSSHPSFCFLVADKLGVVSGKRLRILEKSSDGFALAEADLQTRGAGDLCGRKQSGISDLGMEALKNPKLIEAARLEARRLVSIDSSLANNPVLKHRITSLSFHRE